MIKSHMKVMNPGNFITIDSKFERYIHICICILHHIILLFYSDLFHYRGSIGYCVTQTLFKLFVVTCVNLVNDFMLCLSYCLFANKVEIYNYE